MHSGKQALDAVMLEMGWMVGERIRRMEREEIAGPDSHQTDPALEQWAHEDGSLFLGDQKVTVTRPRLRHVTPGEWPLQSYARRRAPGAFSEDLLAKMLRGVSAQHYVDTGIEAAGAFGVSSSSVARKLVELTVTKLKAFQQRSRADGTPFALFLDAIHRGARRFSSPWRWTRVGKRWPWDSGRALQKITRSVRRCLGTWSVAGWASPAEFCSSPMVAGG
jgi:hypothetical protein